MFTDMLADEDLSRYIWFLTLLMNATRGIPSPGSEIAHSALGITNKETPGAVVELDVQSRPELENAYIEHRLSELERDNGYAQDVLNEMKEEIRRRAQNTFLWVSFVFKDIIKRCVLGPYSPDGKTLASASSDKDSKIWDSTVGTCQQALLKAGHPSLWSFAWWQEPGCFNVKQHLSLWDIPSPARKQTLSTGAAFSSDGKTIVVTSLSRKVHVLHLATDSKTIASIAYDCAARIWDLVLVLAKGLKLYRDSKQTTETGPNRLFRLSSSAIVVWSGRAQLYGCMDWDMRIEHAEVSWAAADSSRRHFPDSRTIALGTTAGEVEL
ncbi:hypothetical protein GB937_006213 [Aspergillus fischeri]|nr:hypothetical protein GB937_006213 [Aspergillus fischeri]